MKKKDRDSVFHRNIEIFITILINVVILKSFLLISSWVILVLLLVINDLPMYCYHHSLTYFLGCSKQTYFHRLGYPMQKLRHLLYFYYCYFLPRWKPRRKLTYHRYHPK
ncbi:hypothetical protein WN66_04805 [Saccharomyces cerevisiae]|nr:hypothetical protein WN66_04805 [Saccharomyces cerevisiae]